MAKGNGRRKKKTSKGTVAPTEMPERVTLVSLVGKFARDPTTQAVAKSIAKGVGKATKAGLKSTAKAINELREKRAENKLTPIEERRLEALERAEFALLRKRKVIKKVI